MFEQIGTETGAKGIATRLLMLVVLIGAMWVLFEAVGSKQYVVVDETRINVTM